MSKNAKAKFASILLLLVCTISLANAEPFQHTSLNYQVCFTPGGECTQDIVNAIADAKKQILVQAYSFTSAPIARALVDAHKRGVDIKIILDKSQKTERYSSSRFLTNEGIPTWIDYRVAIAHNKVMVIDDATVVTGSFNFTSAAQNKNAENLLILQDPNLAKSYTKNWYSRLAQSEAVSATDETTIPYKEPKHRYSRRHRHKRNLLDALQT
jgi:phosphatidylserine/phosphatidylglycerophosphate/cardiolipin synthase-like enzyme